MTLGTTLNWLSRNEVWLGALAALGAILALWRDLLGPLLSWITSSALAVPRPRAARSPAGTIDLRFVPILHRCFWGIGRRGDEPVMQIETEWQVTNLSTTPARLLSARLIKPSLLDPRGFARIHGAPTLSALHSSQFAVPPGETWHVAIGFYLGPPTQTAGKRLRVKFSVIDQLGHAHRVMPLLLNDIATGAVGSPQPTPWWRIW